MARATHAFRLEAARRISGTDDDEVLDGTTDGDRIEAGPGDDVVSGGDGADRLFGGSGFDVLFGGRGADALFGGTGGDFVFGGGGNDRLWGDGGASTAKGSDLASDRLSGGTGTDLLVAGDGNDTLTGGSGADVFLFRWQDPSVALAAGTGRAFATVTDFRPATEELRFDAAGVGTDRASANFVDGGAGDGTPGGEAASFFAGAAAAANGEAVVVLTDQGFATGADAVAAASGEAAGDLILYFNTTVGVASLLYVDGTDAAHSIARFTSIDSVGELAGAGFTADDFLFV